MIISAVHGDKLQALLHNNKLPESDMPRVHEALEKYSSWRNALLVLRGEQKHIITEAVKLLNDYKNYIDIDLIFTSRDDFLYRQKGQLKLDNTVLEEFLPLLVNSVFRDKINDKTIMLGPMACISGMRFDSSLSIETPGGGIVLKQKDQDFAISRRLYLKASNFESFEKSIVKETNIAYFACECKTNLDKTMFQEASATALDLKSSVPTAKYLLLCEWLDMTPINSSTTAIDEIIILRKAKRISSNERQTFSASNERAIKLDAYKNFINSHPYMVDTFMRFIGHINELLEDTEENEILNRGYFKNKYNRRTTSHNRTVYASPPVGGSGFRVARSFYAPFPRKTSGTVCRPWSCCASPYSGWQNVVNSRSVMCNTSLKLVGNILTKVKICGKYYNTNS